MEVLCLCCLRLQTSWGDTYLCSPWLCVCSLILLRDLLVFGLLWVTKFPQAEQTLHLSDPKTKLNINLSSPVAQTPLVLVLFPSPCHSHSGNSVTWKRNNSDILSPSRYYKMKILWEQQQWLDWTGGTTHTSHLHRALRSTSIEGFTWCCNAVLMYF